MATVASQEEEQQQDRGKAADALHVQAGASVNVEHTQESGHRLLPLHILRTLRHSQQANKMPQRTQCCHCTHTNTSCACMFPA
jgi:hypothetical protein